MSLRVGTLRTILASPTGFLVITTGVGYVFGYLYLVFMGRELGPAIFGILGSLVAMFYIASLVGQALREAIASNVAEVRARDGEAAAIATFRKLGVKIGLLCLLPTLVFIAASGPIATFFHSGSIAPIIILAFALFTTLAVDVVMGLMQGLQVFRGIGIVGYVLSQGLKLLFGIAFVWVGWGLNGAIGALLASTAIASVVSLAHMWSRITTRGADGYRSANVSSVIVPALILAVFMAVPSSVDVMLVTHFFNATDAGHYNAVATLGKVVMFLPMAVSFVLLPRAIERHALGLPTRAILLRSLLYAFALSGAVTAVYWLASEQIVRLFFGETYAEAGTLVGWYGTAMLLFSLDFVLIHYSLAVRRIGLMLFADAITVLAIVAMALVHQSLQQVILVLLIGGLLIFVCSLLFLSMPRKP